MQLPYILAGGTSTSIGLLFLFALKTSLICVDRADTTSDYFRYYIADRLTSYRLCCCREQPAASLRHPCGNGNATDYQEELVVLTQEKAVFTIVMNRGCVVQLRSTSCRRSSMRQWQICTSLHAVRSSQSLLRNKQITSVASLMAHSKVGTTGRRVLETWKSSRQHQASSGSRRLPRWSWSISSRLRVGFRPTADLGV